MGHVSDGPGAFEFNSMATLGTIDKQLLEKLCENLLAGSAGRDHAVIEINDGGSPLARCQDSFGQRGVRNPHEASGFG
jgi:hypothetical protein